MSIFASHTQQTIALPMDPPHTVTIRKLSGRSLEQAREAQQLAAVAHLQAMGGAAFQRDLNALGSPAAVAALVAKAQANPLQTYDRYTVLAKGIVAWSYDTQSLTPVDGRIPAIDDLDGETAGFLARAILDLTLPGSDEAARKNAPRPSSVD